MNTSLEIFPLVYKILDTKLQNVKWTYNASKYEVYTTILDKTELSEFVLYCLELKDKIVTIIGIKNHKYPSHFKITPRIFTAPL